MKKLPYSKHILSIQADLQLNLVGGSVKWMGKGSWTGATNAVCIDFYSDDGSIPTFCCSLAEPTLEHNQSSDLTDCTIL